GRFRCFARLDVALGKDPERRVFFRADQQDGYAAGTGPHHDAAGLFNNVQRSTLNQEPHSLVHLACPLLVVSGRALRSSTSRLYSASSRYTMSSQTCSMSSTLRSPKPAHIAGSGLRRLAAVLSWMPIRCSTVPAGSSGAASSA